MNIRKILCLLTGLILNAAPPLSQASPNCKHIGSPGFTGTMALQISSLTVPRDLPIGSVLYQQTFQQAGEGVTIECDVPSAGGGKSTAIVGLRAGNDASRTYETGVPGIGVRWWNGHRYMTASPAWTPAIFQNRCMLFSLFPTGCRSKNLKISEFTEVQLIKTGPVATGVIQASDLGGMRVTAQFEGSNELNVGTLDLTGAINVVSKTCTTPDVSVPLGRRLVSSLTGIGSFTPTVSFEIRLIDCPGFPGKIGGEAAVSSQHGVVKAYTVLPNNLTIRIDPTAGAIDARTGVLRLSQDSTAAGVGVQLLDDAGQPWSLSKDVNVPNVNADRTSVNIRLGARYLQTATEVKAGLANAVATYTLNYQ